MNIDDVRAKIEKICDELNNPNLDQKVRMALEYELEKTCIDYYKLRKFSA